MNTKPPEKEDAGEESFNEFQKFVQRNYDKDTFDYSHCKTLKDVEDAGDTLLLFIILELSDAEDCEDVEDAIGRLETAKEQISELTRDFKENFREVIDNA